MKKDDRDLNNVHNKQKNVVAVVVIVVAVAVIVVAFVDVTMMVLM